MCERMCVIGVLCVTLDHFVQCICILRAKIKLSIGKKQRNKRELCELLAAKPSMRFVFAFTTRFIYCLCMHACMHECKYVLSICMMQVCVYKCNTCGAITEDITCTQGSQHGRER